MRATAWLLAAGVVAAGVPASARTIIVGPHDSIQGAVDQAAPGDTIAVRPGTYHEAGRPCPTEPGTCPASWQRRAASREPLAGPASVRGNSACTCIRAAAAPLAWRGPRRWHTRRPPASPR